MNQPNTSDGPNFRQVLRGYLSLHHLTVEGRDESPEADAVRDSLDLPWRALTEAERGRIQALSIDLFSIGDPVPGGAREMNPQARKNLAETLEARQRGEWDRALTLLRQCDREMAPALLSYLRAGVWLEVGYPEVAVVFYERAVGLEPDNATYQSGFLHALEQSDPRRKLEKADLRIPSGKM